MAAVNLRLGRILPSESENFIVTPEVMFGRHCAILGTSGGGKSWTLAKLVEELAPYRSKVILFDAVGEFQRLPPGTVHYHLGTDCRTAESTEITIPYFHLTENDLFAIFKPTGPVQVTKLKDALRSLKLARLAPMLAPDGTIMKADKNKLHFEEEYQHFITQIETPYADIEIQNLVRQIQHECVDPQRSGLEPRVWGPVNGRDLAECTPLMNKIQDILYSPNLAPVFAPRDVPSIFEVIRNFVKDDEASVMHVSLENLSFFHNAREIAMNAIGRHLLRLGRKGIFRQRPIVVIIDEAHQFLNTAFDAASLDLEAFRLIAKEGRKYALSLCLATQRPRDIPDDIISQMGTIIIHRLANDLDRKIVERCCSELDSKNASRIPQLRPGEALVVGVDFPIPPFVQFTPPHGKPDSSGPNYQRHWALDISSE
jgi:hypothetical protein